MAMLCYKLILIVTEFNLLSNVGFIYIKKHANDAIEKQITFSRISAFRVDKNERTLIAISGVGTEGKGAAAP